MADTSKASFLGEREIAYYRQRFKNRVFSRIAALFAATAEEEGITKKDIAAILNRDPAAITRWLSSSSNLTMETVSDLLLGMGAEMDPHIVRFKDRAIPNYAHPLIDKVLGRPQLVNPSPTPAQTTNVVKIGAVPEPKAGATLTLSEGSVLISA